MLIDYTEIIGPNKLDKFRAKFPVQIKTDGMTGLVLNVPDHVLNMIKTRPLGTPRVNVLESDEFLDTVSEYEYFTYLPDKKLVKLGGFNILEIVLSDILAHLPNNVTILATVPLTEKFDKNIDLLVKQGFSGSRVCSAGLCMTRINSINNQNNNQNNSKEKNRIKYILLQHLSQQEGCTLSAKLDPSTVKYLHISTNAGSTINKNGTITQKEIAGKLHVDHITDDLIQVLVIDYQSIQTGDEEQVNVIDGLFNFHTHPVSAYESHKVSMGWPSAQDYIGYITSFLDTSTILHIVASVEGIYIISLGNYWIDNKNVMDNELSEFISTRYNLCSMSDKKHTSDWYIQRVNGIKYKNKVLFKVVYFSWNSASSIFTVNFPRKMNTCLVDQDEYGNIEY